MVQNFLKLRRCFLTLPRLQVGLAANIIRQHPRNRAEFIGRGRPQQLDRFRRIAAVNFDLRPDGRQRNRIDQSVKRKEPGHFVGDRARLCCVTRQSQGRAT